MPFTNNLAERGIRLAKIKQKISNSLCSFQEAEFYAGLKASFLPLESTIKTFLMRFVLLLKAKTILSK
jgi:hypothetical protein